MKPHLRWNKMIRRWTCTGGGAIGVGMDFINAYANWARHFRNARHG